MSKGCYAFHRLAVHLMHCPVCHPFCTLFIVLLSVSVPYLSSLDLFGLQTKRVGTAYTLQHTLTVGVLGQVSHSQLSPWNVPDAATWWQPPHCCILIAPHLLSLHAQCTGAST